MDDSSSVFVQITTPPTFIVINEGITWLSGLKVRTTEQGLLLKNNESAVLLGAVSEDMCTITFSAVDGRVGVTAHSGFSAPPRPPSE